MHVASMHAVEDVHLSAPRAGADVVPAPRVRFAAARSYEINTRLRRDRMRDSLFHYHVHYSTPPTSAKVARMVIGIDTLTHADTPLRDTLASSRGDPEARRLLAGLVYRVRASHTHTVPAARSLGSTTWSAGRRSPADAPLNSPALRVWRRSAPGH